ncbi:MAG: putative quinol monooxygenase [Promethearchaeota archaeon]
MEITIIAKIKVKEGKMEDAKVILKEIVPKVLNSEPGCLAYIPHEVKGTKNKNTILFYEKYKDKEAFNIHNQNLTKNMEPLMPLLEPGMEIFQCTEIINE